MGLNVGTTIFDQSDRSNHEYCVEHDDGWWFDFDEKCEHLEWHEPSGSHGRVSLWD